MATRRRQGALELAAIVFCGPITVAQAAGPPELLLPRYSADEGKAVTVPTTFGKLEAREYGVHGAHHVAIGVHGSLREDWVLHEWDHAATALAFSGHYNVILPNFHTASQLRAGEISAEQMLQVLKDISHWCNGGSRINLLLGKSWGGGLAAEVAALAPDAVERLALVAPGGLRGLTLTVQSKTALFWARDDPVVPFSSMDNVIHMFKQELFIYAVPSGGHRVLDAYTAKIVDFARQPVLPASSTAQGSSSSNRHDAADLSRSHPKDFLIGVSVVVVISLPLCFLLSVYLRGADGLKKRQLTGGRRAPGPQIVGAAD